MLEGWVCMPLALHETCQIGSLCQLLGPHAIVGAEFPMEATPGSLAELLPSSDLTPSWELNYGVRAT